MSRFGNGKKGKVPDREYLVSLYLTLLCGLSLPRSLSLSLSPSVRSYSHSYNHFYTDPSNINETDFKTYTYIIIYRI